MSNAVGGMNPPFTSVRQKFTHLATRINKKYSFRVISVGRRRPGRPDRTTKERPSSAESADFRFSSSSSHRILERRATLVACQRGAPGMSYYLSVGLNGRNGKEKLSCAASNLSGMRQPPPPPSHVPLSLPAIST